ncbi:MAG TPA: response regulator transcription factor [Ideonella sp.]|nr:response regulator transcription factor [Ideonella sp.]
MTPPPVSGSDHDRPASPIGVLVVDDQPAVREGLARLIACAPMALRFVSTAATGAEALSATALLRPELVVLDVDLNGEDGLALLPQLVQTAAVLVLTSHGDPATRERARELGALAFIEKHQPAAELLGALVRLGCVQTRGDKAPGGQGASAYPPMVAASDAPARRHP